jgi:hypothetical protein
VCFLGRKGSIVLSKAPGYSRVSIWTASIDGIGIVEIDTDSIGFLPVPEPSEELFPPVHTDIAMYFSGSDELVLCCVPERVFCSAMF